MGIMSQAARIGGILTPSLILLGRRLTGCCARLYGGPSVPVCAPV